MDVKKKILQACTELAQEKGFYNTSVNELAARAGISKKTMYRYYRSKREIIEAALDDFMEETARMAIHVSESEHNPEAVLKTLFTHLFTSGQFLINPVTLNDLRFHYPELWEKLDAFRMEKGLSISYRLLSSRETQDNNLDPRIISRAVLACVQAVLNPEFILENGFTFEYAAKQLTCFITSALK